MRRRSSVHRLIAAAIALLGTANAAQALDDDVATLAAAICSAPDTGKMGEALASRGTSEAVPEEQVAEAFGVASYLASLGRCANRTAIADGYALYKSDKDLNQLDAAFAVGHVSARPDDKAAVYKGSFEVLGGAGEPTSRQ